MRYNFSPSLWILVYVIFVWSYKLFSCNDFCNRFVFYQYEIVIIENDTYRYSLHYNYSMRIQHNQPQPVPSERFKNKINRRYTARSKVSFSFYGSQVREIDFHDGNVDNVYEFGGSRIGNIFNFIKNYTKSESWFLDENELLGVQKNYSTNVNGTEVKATMTSLIHPNGKVSFYYDNIPKEIDGSKLQSKIVGIIHCEDGTAFHEIRVPAKWIESGTLVEFEAIGEICSQYNTNETCQNAKISILTCFWCEKEKKCIISNLQDTHDCHVEKKSDVNDLSTSTPIKDIETTLRSTKVQNMTTRTTEENKQYKSHWYLYVVIPLVASLFLICIGYIIWRWLLRRKRTNE
uniref:Egg protein CP391S-like protein n=1 Tax=Schistosoma mansoni TaxID=6183 RepID=A0AA82N8G5_SCHMA